MQYISECKASSIQSTCNMRHPPGKELYHDNNEKIAVYEVDGEKEKVCKVIKINHT